MSLNRIGLMSVEKGESVVSTDLELVLSSNDKVIDSLSIDWLL